MNQLNWRKIFTFAGIFGLLAGGVPIFMGLDFLLSTLPVAAMFSIYFLVPRIQERRLVTAMITSILTAAIAVAVFTLYQFATVASAVATNNLVVVLKTSLLTVLFICIAGSFFFVKTHEWTEKKRLQVEEKRAAKRAEEVKVKGKDTKHYKVRSKRKYKKK